MFPGHAQAPSHAGLRHQRPQRAMPAGERMPIDLGMKEQLVPDALWEWLAPLLPRRRAHHRGGRPWADDRAAFRGILFVLKTGIAWRDLPAEVFGISGVTRWRRLAAWTRAGIFERLQQQLLDELGMKVRIDWSRARSTRAASGRKGGPRDGQEPHRPREERTLAWLHSFKRLRVREERRADVHLALLQLGCCLVLAGALDGGCETSS